MTRSRTPYRPRFSWRPIVAVRHRRHDSAYGEIKRGWRLYLFGVVPTIVIPRRAS